MVIRPAVIAVICVGLFSIFESLMIPKALALGTNGFNMDDRRSQRRPNYMLPRARDEEILRGLKNRGESFDTEIDTLDAIGRIPEELAYIVDYDANTFDDEDFLDKSIEAKKRGNIELEKRYQDQSLPEPDSPCECKYIEGPELMGYNIFPRAVVSRSCSNTPQLRSCPYPYKCEEIIYPVATLKMKPHKDIYAPSETIDLLPPRLRKLSLGWNIEYKNVSVGCRCTNKFVTSNKQ